VRQLRIHDTLSGEVVPVQPSDRGRIGIYACGPTVYGRIHVGNARPYVIFALLKRFLEHEGYDALLVVNVTDVNDKIYDAARERGVPSEELAREMTAATSRTPTGSGSGGRTTSRRRPRRSRPSWL
jgi:cysteinyl-tRNA synthetase